MIVSSTFSISVPPRIHHISSGGHLQVKKGASVRIECSASGEFPSAEMQFQVHQLIIALLFRPPGNPSPNVTWTKKFENLPNGKNHVVSISVAISNYLCESFCKNSPSTRLSIQLIKFITLAIMIDDYPHAASLRRSLFPQAKKTKKRKITVNWIDCPRQSDWVEYWWVSDMHNEMTQLRLPISYSNVKSNKVRKNEIINSHVNKVRFWSRLMDFASRSINKQDFPFVEYFPAILAYNNPSAISQQQQQRQHHHRQQQQQHQQSENN